MRAQEMPLYPGKANGNGGLTECIDLFTYCKHKLFTIVKTFICSANFIILITLQTAKLGHSFKVYVL